MYPCAAEWDRSRYPIMTKLRLYTTSYYNGKKTFPRPFRSIVMYFHQWYFFSKLFPSLGRASRALTLRHSATFHMAILKLVEPFSEGSFRLFGDGTGPTLRLTNAMHIMSNLWAYRAAFGLHHEYWLLQACFASANSVLRDLNTSTASVEVFGRACRLLYDIGVYLPLANDLLVVIKGTLARTQIQPPASVTKIFSGLSIRGGSVQLRGVRLALPLHDAKGMEIIGTLGAPQDVTFDEQIGSIDGIN